MDLYLVGWGGSDLVEPWCINTQQRLNSTDFSQTIGTSWLIDLKASDFFPRHPMLVVVALAQDPTKTLEISGCSSYMSIAELKSRIRFLLSTDDLITLQNATGDTIRDEKPLTGQHD